MGRSRERSGRGEVNAARKGEKRTEGEDAKRQTVTVGGGERKK